jgi:DNA excision repair protein ERCC-3
VPGPIIVQSDRTVLLETASDRFEEARDALTRFAELEKSPEHIHTYRITPLSLWNAAAAGMRPDEVTSLLEDLSRFPVPPIVTGDVAETMARYGRLTLEKEEGGLILRAEDELLATEIEYQEKVRPMLLGRADRFTLLVDPRHRGAIKQALLKVGHPVCDLAGYTAGTDLSIQLRFPGLSGLPWEARTYQKDAIRAFHADGSERGGNGAVVLPCGAGKTVVGILAMAAVGQHTLILTTSVTALRQWRTELLERTELTDDQIGEYSGEVKAIRPVTLSTYQILTYRRSKEDDFVHFGLFDREEWGLVIYDEVHLLPAPVFRATAEIQARRRLGLTATLVREDGREGDVFSLIGPKRFDVPWRVLERQGWIAEALCTEVRVPFPDTDHRMEYAVASQRARFRLASENPAKVPVLRDLLEEHRHDRVLVIGQYLDQLRVIADEIGAPIITGTTASKRRDTLYEEFRQGEHGVLIVSKVANFAIDLPDANVAVQVSGTFGSRQEEAQRLGRILRPKGGENVARFYTLVTQDTSEQEFAAKRQLFLTEQGYQYSVRPA